MDEQETMEKELKIYQKHIDETKILHRENQHAYILSLEGETQRGRERLQAELDHLEFLKDTEREKLKIYQRHLLNLEQIAREKQ